MDELTTGLDPQARRMIWDLIRNIRSRGKTVFITTHYMEEAELLCDRVAVVDQGRIIALDTPENLVRSLEVDSRVLFLVDVKGPFRPEPLQELNSVSQVERNGERVIIHGRGETLVGEVVNLLTANGVRFRDLRTEQATLDDFFLTMTGRKMRN